MLLDSCFREIDVIIFPPRRFPAAVRCCLHRSIDFSNTAATDFRLWRYRAAVDHPEVRTLSTSTFGEA